MRGTRGRAPIRRAKRASDEPHIEAALTALRTHIAEQFPGAHFSIARGLGDDREGVYLIVSVDLDDPDEVLDAVMDELLELQIDRRLPVYVLPTQTPERVEAELDRRRASTTPTSLPR